ncbi:MAG: hypothetical protein ACRC6V_16145 [Bacteroidales bacterium]
MTELSIRMNTGINPMVKWGTNNYSIYHAGNRPSASDVGAVARAGDNMSGVLTVPASRGLRTANQSDGSWTSLSAENGYSMMWKFNNSTTVNDEFVGIYKSNLIFRQDTGAGNKTAKDWKVYHEGFKPTAADIGAMGSAGGTITGDLVLNEKLTVKKDMIVDLGNGLRKVTKTLGPITNNKGALVMLCPNTKSTGRGAHGFDGRISLYRGASDQYNLVSWIDLTARVAYTDLAATIHDQYSNRQTSDTMKLVLVTHKGEQWVALHIASTSTRIVTIDGVVTNVDPEFINNSDGYVTIDLNTNTDIVRSTRSTRTLDVTDSSSIGGYRFNNKIAIGGTNDSWLRLNPNSHFSSGIYSPTGIIRHDGGDIQLKNWGTGTAKPVRVTIPSSEQYVSSNPGAAVVNVKTPGSNNATRLFNVYDDAGVMKSSIVSRDDASGALSFITHGGTDAKQRVTISNGSVYAYGDQVANNDALTKVSYTEGRYLRKTSDTMTGTLTATDVQARLTHSLGYLSIKPYGSTYDDGSFIRGYYRAHDNGNPGSGWAGIKFDKFTPASGGTASKSEGFDMQLGNNFVYHTGRKPTADELKVLSTESTHVNTAVDFNNYVINGNYNIYASSAANLTNAPTGFQYGTLQVIGRGSVGHSFVTQTATNKNNNHQWIRTRTDGAFAWSKWDKIFSEANPPTVDQLDAVKRTGDIMTGHLYMDNNADIYLRGKDANNPIIWFMDQPTNSSKVAIFHDRNGDRFAINHYAADGKYSAFRMKVGEKAPTFTPSGGGTFHMYHEGFKPTATDVGAPVMNSTTRAVILQTPDAGIQAGTIRTVREDAGQVTWMTDKPLEETYKAIGIHSIRGPVYNDGAIRDIYHTGRKPQASDIDGLITQGSWGLGDYPSFSDAAMGENYTEDKSRDLNKLITTGTYTINGSWTNTFDNKGTALTMYASIQVIARKATTGMTVYQKLIVDKQGDGSRFFERQGNGAYPNTTWSKWKAGGSYESNLEYRLTLDRPGPTAYPYMTLHKREDRVDLTSGFYSVGAVQFKHGALSDANNPDSGKLVGLVRSDTSWDRKANRTVLSVRKASDNSVGTELILEEDQATFTRGINASGEIKNKGSNGFRMSEGQIGTFWRKDSSNLYLMRTESGQAESGTWSAHRPFSMDLASAKVTIGNGLIVREGLELLSPLVAGTQYIKGANNGIIMRDHGNGNVTLSAGQNADGTAGDLYLGYNATASGTNGYKTRNVKLTVPMVSNAGAVIIDGTGGINGDSISGGAFQVLTDGNNVKHTIVGGSDTINRGRTIVAAGESGKQIADNTSTGAEDLHLAADGTIFLETSVQSGYATRKTIKMTAGEIYAVDGTKRVYHQGFKPSAGDMNAAPAGFGLGGNGARCPNENCDEAVQSGFYAIYAGTTGTPEGTGPSGSKMIVTAWSNQHISQMFFRVTDNRTYTRSSKLVNSVVVWGDWAELYSTERKPTVTDLGAVARTDVNFDISGGYSTIVNKIPRVKSDGVMEVGKYIDFHEKDSTADFDSRLEVVGKDLRVQGGKLLVGSNEVYHTGRKPTPADIGAMPIGGGTVTGTITATAISTEKMDMGPFTVQRNGNKLQFLV